MRGTRTKALRRLADSVVSTRGETISEETLYVEAPRSRRKKSVPTGQIRTTPEGEKVAIKIEYETFTARLSAGCRRFYRQRMKRLLKGNHVSL